MKKLYEISLLLDFYGQLITGRQYEIMDLHYNSDYSLAEIADYFNISRQGVYDSIKRGKAILNDYENKLGLVKRFSEHQEKARMILEKINSIDISALEKSNIDKFNEVKRDIQALIDEL